MLMGRLFDADVAIAEIDPHEVDPARLLDAERLIVAKAVPKRQREFAAGRVLARTLLTERFGTAADVPLIAGDDRAPRWPDGIVGSITHCADLACVVVASRDQYLSLGCDVEERAPVSPGVAKRVAGSPREWAALGSGDSRYELARVVFSAKEAFYKLQYPVTGCFLGFSDAEVMLDLEHESFELRLGREAGPLCAGDLFPGRVVLTDRHIATGLAIRA